MKPIPLLCIPVLNRGDLLARCIQSIDAIVESVFIVNNGNDKSVLRAIENATCPRISVIHNKSNAGVAASWNRAIDIMMRNNLPHVMICGSDIKFGPNHLDQVNELSYSHPEFAGVWGHWYNFFSVHRTCVEKVGTFDENFFPSCMEDNDYERRIVLSGLPTIHKQNPHTIHAEPPLYYSGSTIRASEGRLFGELENNRNLNYYQRKWGNGPGKEEFITPFNDPNHPIDKWTKEAG